MAIEHQLARLTAKGPAITGEGFGGIAELSQTDVAASLSGLRGDTYYFMRVKFCDDDMMRAKLRSRIAFRIITEAIRGEKDISAKISFNLAGIILQQAVDGSLCKTCDGSGAVQIEAEIHDCGSCDGTGRRPLSARAASRIAGVSGPTYSKHYLPIVQRFTSHLQSLEQIGLRHASRRLYGKSDGNDGAK